MKAMVIATMKSGMGQAVVLLLSLISMKILAVLTGPSGVGLFSIIRNAQQSLTAVAALGGGGNAIVQGVASWPSPERGKYLVTAFWIFVLFNLLVVAAILTVPVELTEVLISKSGDTILPWLIPPVILSSVMVYFRGVLNAYVQIASVAWVNVITALGAVIFIYPAYIAYSAGLFQGLILILFGAFLFGSAASIFFVKREINFNFRMVDLFTNYSLHAGIRVVYIALPTMVASFVGMASVFYIRMAVVKSYGISAAAWFDVAWGIGAIYLTLFLTSLQTYLLPTASAKTTEATSSLHLSMALRFSTIAVVPVLLCLIVFKPLVINILYSNEFLPALEIMRWTLLGDLFRSYGSVFATILIARADMLAFLIREMVWCFVFVVTAYLLMPYGVWVVGVAYLCAYMVYFIMHAWRVYSSGLFSVDSLVLKQWLIGCLMIVLATVFSWSDMTVHWWSFLILLAGVAYAYLLMTKSERAYLAFWFNKFRR